MKRFGSQIVNLLMIFALVTVGFSVGFPALERSLIPAASRASSVAYKSSRRVVDSVNDSIERITRELFKGLEAPGN